MTEDECLLWTRFTKDQLADLIPRLRLPEYFMLEYNNNFRMRLSGETWFFNLDSKACA